MFFLKKKVNRDAIPDLIPDYIENTLRPAVAILKDGIKEIKPVETGRNTFLRIITTPNGRKIIVRIFPFNPNKEKAIEHCYISTLFNKCGLKTPAILFKDTSPETRQRFGFDVVVEEHSDGQHILMETLNLDAAVRKNFVRHILDLHSRKDTNSGKVWRPKNERENPVAYYLERSSLYLKRVSNNIEEMKPKDQKKFLSAIEHLLHRIEDINEFNLIHGDIQDENIIFTPEKDFVFLDFGTSCFGYFEEDLAGILYGIYGGARDGFNLFLHDYFEVADKEHQKRYEHTQAFFYAYYYLEKASSSSEKVRRIQEGIKSSQPDAVTKFMRSKAERMWEKFLLTIQQSHHYQE